jgi:rod shape-determining protein MreD
VITKKNNLPQNWFKFLVIFLVTTLLTQINLPFLNDIRLIPDYFIALIIPAIIFRFKNINIFIVFILGILVDLFIGELIGQYAITFLIIYISNFVLHKFFVFKSTSQVIFLYFILLEIGFLIIGTTSISYLLQNSDMNVLVYKNIMTIPICFVYKLIFEKMSNY